MRLDLNTIVALMSIIMCVQSNRSFKQGSRRYRPFREWTRDQPVRKRDGHNHRNMKLMALTAAPLPVAECCRSVTEIIQPMGGVSTKGRILELYRDNNSTQSFYQTSCAKGVKGKPCKYIARQYNSRCVQRYSYTYALVRDYESQGPPRMDYIRVRSGCSCEVRRPKNKII